MIYVVRHGQTDWNKEGRLQGRSGLSLNQYGMEQADSLREELEHIRFAYVFSSPQNRAVQTAEIVSGCTVITDARLDVFDLGEADGLKKGDVKMAGVVPDPAWYKGVEETRDFVKRVFAFMRDLETKYGSEDDPNMLIAGHKCTTGCIGAYFNGLPDDGNILRFSSDNGRYKTYSFKKID